MKLSAKRARAEGKGKSDIRNKKYTYRTLDMTFPKVQAVLLKRKSIVTSLFLLVELFISAYKVFCQLSHPLQCKQI